jgi:YidC/Oxa1 family membrane protein insertase
MKALTALQPKIRELQKRYAKDRQKLSQETMRLYREAGVSPLGCLGPLVIQLPIWIGLYQALIQTLPTTPDSLLGLSQKLYAWIPIVHSAVPLESGFLWLDLARPDPTPILPVLVGASTWVQQKMTTPPATDPKQASTNQMMLWMMPLMLAFFTFQFPSGLALYWIISNVIGVGIQYFITGWGPLFAKTAPAPTESGTTPAAAPQPVKEKREYGDARGHSKERRRSDRAGAKRAGRKEGRGGGGSSKQG